MVFKITPCMSVACTWSTDSIPNRGKKFLVFHTNPGRKCGPFNPNSVSTLTRPSAVKRPGREADHSLPLSAKVGTRCNCISTFPYAFMECKRQLQVLCCLPWLVVPYSVALNMTRHWVTFKIFLRYFCQIFQIFYVSVSLYCNSFSQVFFFFLDSIAIVGLDLFWSH